MPEVEGVAGDGGHLGRLAGVVESSPKPIRTASRTVSGIGCYSLRRQLEPRPPPCEARPW